MAKQLIVVVHGVGVKEAGISTDLLSTSLERSPEQITGLKREQMSYKILRPHSSDDFHLREYEKYSEKNLRATFPARIRRYRQYESRSQDAVANERVIADFYWGDIAAIGTGVFGLLVALLKTILGLSHAVRENARDVFPKPDGWDPWMRRIASSAALLIHGPIAAINIVLLVGAFIAWGLQSWTGKPGGGEWSGFLVALFAIVGGFLALRAGYAYLARHFAGWVLITGLVLLAFSIVGLAANHTGVGDPFAWFDAELQKASCRFVDQAERTDCVSGYEGIYLYGLRLLALMWIGWLLVFALALFTGTVVFARSAERHKRGRVSLLMSAISLMTLLWFLMIACIWAAIAQLDVRIIPNPTYINSALWGLVPALLALFSLLVAAGVVLNRKRELKKKMSTDDYMRDRERLAERYRLIVSRWMMVVLVVFVVTMIALSLISLTLDPEDLTAAGTVLVEIMSAMPVAMTIAALVGAAVIGIFRTSFAAGLGILTDVLTYLNDYSWDSREILRFDSRDEPVYKGHVSRTFVERILGWRKKIEQTSRPKGYWLRERIQDRLKVLMNQLIRQEQPDEVAIVSHSQGTVIAIDVIAEEGANWLSAMPEGGRLKLVTMGSPYTHLHHHYFRSSFRSHHERPALRKRDETTGPSEQNPGVLSRWVNIFRIDDFVGTYIDAPRDRDGRDGEQCLWPEEKPVSPNGHTMYWVDENVYPILREALEFKFDP